MGKSMTSDEKTLHTLFVEINELYQAARLEDAKAGLELFEAELNSGSGIYSLIFYTRATLAAQSLSHEIALAEYEKSPAGGQTGEAKTNASTTKETV